MSRHDELDDILVDHPPRATPRPALSIMQPDFTWDQPEPKLQKASRGRSSGSHRKPQCNHHPLLWVFTWLSLSLSVYLAGALIGLPS